MKLPGDNMVITLTIEDFDANLQDATKVQRSFVLDTTQVNDHGPEFKFSMVEYIVEKIMKEMKEVFVPNEEHIQDKTETQA